MTLSDLGRADWTDSERVAGLVESYNRRYGPSFWEVFEELVGPRRCRRVVEFGCGPGLFLLDASRRLGAETVYGIDSSPEMIGQAREFLESLSSPIAFELILSDVDTELPELETCSADLVFMGFLLHELKNPFPLISYSNEILDNQGVCAVYDYVSGNEEAFVRGMTALGMAEEKARLRYPHMCRNSIDDIINLLLDAGLRLIGHKIIDDFRAIVVGIKDSGDGET